MRALLRRLRDAADQAWRPRARARPVRFRVDADVPVDLGCIKLFRAESFPESGPSPWLDRPDSANLVSARQGRGELSAEQAELCRFWMENGYVILRGAIDPGTVEAAWAAYEEAIASGAIVLKPEPISADDPHPGRFLNPHQKVPAIDSLLRHPVLVNFASLVLGRPAIPFQTITSHKGSQQGAHSDSIHMTTYPVGYLAACWVAMEDIHPDSGPLVYYPGSHRQPYLFSHDVGIGADAFQEQGYALYHERYEPAIRRNLEAYGSQPRYFLPKKGDVLFWHANLVHGGSPRNDPQRTRKAIVHHYFAEGCVCYHDLSAAPAGVHGPAKNFPVCGAEGVGAELPARA